MVGEPDGEKRSTDRDCSRLLQHWLLITGEGGDSGGEEEEEEEETCLGEGEKR